MVLGTITIFVLVIIVLPLLKDVMKATLSKAGGQSEMLGDMFHLPYYWKNTIEN